MCPHHPLRVALIGLAGLVIVAAVGFGVLIATFDPNAYKPRIVTAVRAATGRDLALNGPIQLAFFPRPGITLHDVVLANPPGFSGPPMASVRELTLRVELGALVRRRVVVRELVLDRPEIALERNAAGVPNWQFPAPASQPIATVPQPVAERASAPAGFAVLDARVRDGALSYRDDRTGQTLALAVPHLTITAAAPDAPAHLTGDAVLAGTRFALHADTGRLTGLSEGGPWPVKAGVTADGEGLHVALDVTAPASDKPMHAAVQGSLRGVAFSATAETGAPSLLSGAAPAPYPISLEAQAAGARFAAQGAITQLVRLAGVDLALSAQVPDLAALSPLAGRPLPALRGLTATALLSDHDGLRSGLILRDLRLAAEPGDLAGSADIAFAPRPVLHATLSGTRLDLSALRPAVPPPPPPANAPARPPAPARAPVGHVIPDTPIPFAALRAADADVRLKVATVRAGADTWREADAHVTLAGGALAVSARGSLGAAPAALTLTADSRSDPPAVALALNAPALPLAPVLAAAGQPAFAAGNLAISAELRGAGASPHAIAAGLDGFLAASMTGGTIETRVLEHAIGPAIAKANPLGMLGGGGQSEIRCLALRLTAKGGKAEVAPLLLSSPLITLSGTGQLDLAAETVDLHLEPQGRAGGVAFAVPVSVHGGFRDPHVAVTEAAAAATGLRAALGLLAGKGLGGAAAVAGPSCADALAATRR